jgi:hypothetical protein
MNGERQVIEDDVASVALRDPVDCENMSGVWCRERDPRR